MDGISGANLREALVLDLKEAIDLYKVGQGREGSLIDAIERCMFHGLHGSKNSDIFGSAVSCDTSFWSSITSLQAISPVLFGGTLEQVNELLPKNRTDRERCRAWLRLQLNDQGLEYSISAVAADRYHTELNWAPSSLFRSDIREKFVSVLSSLSSIPFDVCVTAFNGGMINPPCSGTRLMILLEQHDIKLFSPSQEIVRKTPRTRMLQFEVLGCGIDDINGLYTQTGNKFTSERGYEIFRFNVPTPSSNNKEVNYTEAEGVTAPTWFIGKPDSKMIFYYCHARTEFPPKKGWKVQSDEGLLPVPTVEFKTQEVEAQNSNGVDIRSVTSNAIQTIATNCASMNSTFLQGSSCTEQDVLKTTSTSEPHSREWCAGNTRKRFLAERRAISLSINISSPLPRSSPTQQWPTPLSACSAHSACSSLRSADSSCSSTPTLDLRHHSNNRLMSPFAEVHWKMIRPSPALESKERKSRELFVNERKILWNRIAQLKQKKTELDGVKGLTLSEDAKFVSTPPLPRKFVLPCDLPYIAHKEKSIAVDISDATVVTSSSVTIEYQSDMISDEISCADDKKVFDNDDLLVRTSARATRSSIAVSLTSAEVVKGSDRHVGYWIRVTLRLKGSLEDEVWNILRRYSKFKSLHNGLVKLFPKLLQTKRIPTLPPTSFSRCFDVAYIERQRGLLELYLKSICSLFNQGSLDENNADGGLNSALKSFLHAQDGTDYQVASCRKTRGGQGLHLSLNLNDPIDEGVNLCQAEVTKRITLQNNACAGCDSILSKSMFNQTYNLCEYSRLYFCSQCHVGDSWVLPALILKRWSFEERKISNISKSYLSVIHHQPLFCVSAINPQLFDLVPELKQARLLRIQLNIMNGYVKECTTESSIITSVLGSKKYLVEESEMFSLQDLLDVKNGSLNRLLQVLVDDVNMHIKTDCDVCKVKASICSICSSPSMKVFPFDVKDTMECRGGCGSYVHRACFLSTTKACHFCNRKQDIDLPSL